MEAICLGVWAGGIICMLSFFPLLTAKRKLDSARRLNDDTREIIKRRKRRR